MKVETNKYRKRFKAQPTNAFFATIKCTAAPRSFRLLARRAITNSNSVEHSRKLAGASEQSIDGGKKRI